MHALREKHQICPQNREWELRCLHAETETDKKNYRHLAAGLHLIAIYHPPYPLCTFLLGGAREDR